MLTDLWTRLARRYARVLCWLFPPKGWRKLVKQRRHGSIKWPAPVEGKPALVGFPLQWLVASADPETSSGLRYPTSGVQCSACGGAVEPAASAVRCARCGVPLHDNEDCAHMEDSLDIPACRWCQGAISRV